MLIKTIISSFLVISGIFPSKVKFTNVSTVPRICHSSVNLDTKPSVIPEAFWVPGGPTSSGSVLLPHHSTLVISSGYSFLGITHFLWHLYNFHLWSYCVSLLCWNAEILSDAKHFVFLILKKETFPTWFSEVSGSAWILLMENYLGWWTFSNSTWSGRSDSSEKIIINDHWVSKSNDNLSKIWTVPILIQIPGYCIIMNLFL